MYFLNLSVMVLEFGSFVSLDFFAFYLRFQFFKHYMYTKLSLGG